MNLDYWAATDKFYEVLFEKAPGVEALFGDITNQRGMFVFALKTIGGETPESERTDEYIKMLGNAHKRQGLTSEHMEIGREAFRASIEAGGRDLSDEGKRQYLDAFTELELAMGFDVKQEN